MLDEDFLSKILLDLDWIASWMTNLKNEKATLSISIDNKTIRITINFRYQEIKTNFFKNDCIPLCNIKLQEGYYSKEQIDVLESIGCMIKIDELAKLKTKNHNLKALKFLIYYNLLFFEYDRHINNLDSIFSLNFQTVRTEFYESTTVSKYGLILGEGKPIFNSDQLFSNWEDFINPNIIEHIPINTDIVYPKEFGEWIQNMEQRHIYDNKLAQFVFLDHGLLIQIFISLVRCSKKIKTRKVFAEDKDKNKPTDIFKEFIGKDVKWKEVTFRIKYFEKIKIQIIIRDKNTRLRHPHEFGLSKKSSSNDLMIDLLDNFHKRNNQLQLYPSFEYKGSWKQTKELLKNTEHYHEQSYITLKDRTNRLRGIIRKLFIIDGKPLIEDGLPISDPRTDGYYHLRFKLEIE